MIKAVFATLAIALLFSGAHAQDGNGTTGGNGTSYGTIAEAAEANGLTTLLALAQGSPLADALSDPSFMGIVFAPTNQAFEQLNSTLNGTLGQVPPDVVNQILQYHVIPGNSSNPSLDLTNRSVLDTALAGANSEQVTSALTFVPTATQNTTQALYVGGTPGNGDATVDPASNVSAAQGTVYVINEVLIPPSNPSILTGQPYPLTVAQAVQGTPELSTFLSALQANPDVLQLFTDPNAAYTIFAPNNVAFENYLAATNMTADQLPALLSMPEVGQLLRAHVLDTTPLLSSEIQDGSSTTLPTLSGDQVTVSADSGNVTVQGAGNQDPVYVVEPDQLAGKSVVHFVNNLIIPAMASNGTDGGNGTVPTPGDATPPAPGTVTPASVDGASSSTFSAVIAGLMLMAALFSM